MSEKIIGPAAGKTFQELLADEAQINKDSLVLSVIDAFKKGEPSAIKLVTQSLLDSQYSETTKFPINDERFKEIINFASDRIRASQIQGS